jgi:glycerol-3-phosphate O-acyltransferase
LASTVDIKADNNDSLIYAKTIDKSLMLLGYYRNALGRVFLHEGFVTSWLFKLRNEKIVKQKLKEKYDYLFDLLHAEYLIPSPTFEDTIELLKAKGVVLEYNEGVIEAGKDEFSLFWINYLASFVWSLLECYFGNRLFLYFFIVGRKVTYSIACHKVIL